jgi:hypothetical protein
MRKYSKVFILGLLFCIFVAPVFSQNLNTLEDLKGFADDFFDNMAQSLPFNASMGLNWSDSQIRKFPNFGAGLSMGYTTMSAVSFEGLLKQFSIDLPVDLGGYPLPGWALEGRLGGFFLPFDVGFKFGWMPIDVSAADIKMDYLLTGFDFRYAILEGKGPMPMVSVGAGFNYLNGGLALGIGEERKFNYIDLSLNRQTLTLEKPTIGISWETATLDFKAQVSKSFRRVTPYFGIGASVGWSQAGYNVEAKVTDTGNNLQSAKNIFHALGIDEIDANGFSTMKDFNGWSFRSFGGVGLQLAVMRMDITYLLNFVDKNYGVSMGLRFNPGS